MRLSDWVMCAVIVLQAQWRWWCRSVGQASLFGEIGDWQLGSHHKQEKKKQVQAAHDYYFFGLFLFASALSVPLPLQPCQALPGPYLAGVLPRPE